MKLGKPTEPFHLRSKDGAFLTVLPPIVHNLKIKKPKTRKVFTFKGIQSSKGVTHLRETGLVYNNVYPDVDRKSGLILPKTLVKTEDRPNKQQKTSRHKRKLVASLEDVEKQLKKPRRVKKAARRVESERDERRVGQRVATKEEETKEAKAKRSGAEEAKETQRSEAQDAKEIKCSEAEESDQEMRPKKTIVSK